MASTCSGKACMCSTLSHRSFPSVSFEMVPVFIWLMMALTCPFSDDCRALPLSLSSPGYPQPDLSLTFRHGAAERVYRLEFVSNQDFTDSEFQKWVETMSCGDLELPTLPDMERKMSDIRNTYHYKFNENDIEQVVYSLLFVALIGLGFFFLLRCPEVAQCSRWDIQIYVLFSLEGGWRWPTRPTRIPPTRTEKLLSLVSYRWNTTQSRAGSHQKWKGSEMGYCDYVVFPLEVCLGLQGLKQ